MIDLSVKLGGINFDNPIFVASGTYGYGIETAGITNPARLGAIVTKSITLKARTGNKPPRIVETSSGMINSIGLANLGVEAYVNEMLPIYEKIGTKIIMNVAGFEVDEFSRIIRIVEDSSNVITGYEVNISCPNVKKGGMQFGVDPKLTAAITAKVRKATDKLLIIKLSPNVTDITSIAQAVEDNGADAVSAINTVVGMSIDSNTGKSNIFTTYGGLSGPAIKPIGLAAVNKIYNKISIPIIGVGGIVSETDVIEYFLAGAAAVQVGTANFRDPRTGENIINDLKIWCESNDIKKLSNLTGKLKVYS